MTIDAREAGMKRVFYHGGRAGLPVGGYILPPAETGNNRAEVSAKKLFGEGGLGEVWIKEKIVYVTTQLAWATFHAAKHSCRGWVYEVEPEGEIEDDPDMEGAPVGA